jgi:hypothetical protein
MLVSRSYSAVAIEVSISEGEALEGLLAAILFNAAFDILMVMIECKEVEVDEI